MCPHLPGLAPALPADALITHARAHRWHGGGNWGDLWENIQVSRLKSIPKLLAANKTIFGAPPARARADEGPP